MNNLGKLLVGFNQDLTFTDRELREAIQSRHIDRLKLACILHSYQSNEWWCDNCQERHEFDYFEDKRYKRCSEDTLGIREQVTLDEPLTWQWSWEQFRSTLCQVNQLSPVIRATRDAFMVGSATKHLVCWVPWVKPDDIIRTAKVLRAEYEGKTLLLLLPEGLVLTNTDIAQLKALDTRIETIDKVLQAQWQLSMNTATESIQPRVVLNLKKHELRLDGETCPFPSNRQYLLRTVKIFIIAGGDVVTQAAFSEQYYAISAGGHGVAVDVAGNVYKLRQHLKKHLPKALEDNDIILTVTGQGYRFNPEFLPAEVLDT